MFSQKEKTHVVRKALKLHLILLCGEFSRRQESRCNPRRRTLRWNAERLVLLTSVVHGSPSMLAGLRAAARGRRRRAVSLSALRCPFTTATLSETEGTSSVRECKEEVVRGDQ